MGATLSVWDLSECRCMSGSGGACARSAMVPSWASDLRGVLASSLRWPAVTPPRRPLLLGGPRPLGNCSPFACRPLLCSRSALRAAARRLPVSQRGTGVNDVNDESWARKSKWADAAAGTVDWTFCSTRAVSGLAARVRTRLTSGLLRPRRGALSRLICEPPGIAHGRDAYNHSR